MRLMKVAVLVAAALASVSAAGSARASEIIDRNAQNVRLGVDASGHALVTYKVRGRVMHVRAWGAIDARQPTTSRPQRNQRAQRPRLLTGQPDRAAQCVLYGQRPAAFRPDLYRYPRPQRLSSHDRHYRWHVQYRCPVRKISIPSQPLARKDGCAEAAYSDT